MGKEDFLINIGIAAGRGERNRVFLCNKIFELMTQRTFYPDMLYRHPFSEVQVVTVSQPIEELGEAAVSVCYDMEAAAVYQAGVYFFGPHQMSFLKVVSDAGMKANDVTPKEVEQIFTVCIDEIADYIHLLMNVENGKEQSEMDIEAFGRLCGDLHCSKVMEDSLRLYLRYCMLSGIDFVSVISELYREQRLPCKDKREGKVCFEELKRRLL